MSFTRGRGSGGWVEKVRGFVADLDDFERFPWPRADGLDFSPLAEIGSRLPRNVKARGANH